MDPPLEAGEVGKGNAPGFPSEPARTFAGRAAYAFGVNSFGGRTASAALNSPKVWFT
jgi:hypothetical protein